MASLNPSQYGGTSLGPEDEIKETAEEVVNSRMNRSDGLVTRQGIKLLEFAHGKETPNKPGPLSNEGHALRVRVAPGRHGHAAMRGIEKRCCFEGSSDYYEGVVKVGSKLSEEGDKYDPTETKDHRIKTMATSLIVSVLVAVLIFCNLYFHVEATLQESIITTLFILTLLVASVALSLRMRCASVLVLFSLFAREGRMLFFSLITSFLLNGPVTNIVYNAEQMSTSLGCYGDLAVQQGAVLQQRIQDTINRSTLLLKANLRKVQEVANAFNSAMNPLTVIINGLKDGASAISDSMNSVSLACRQGFETAYDTCLGIGNQCGKLRVARSIWDDIKKIPGTIHDAILGTLEDGKNAFCGAISEICQPLKIPSASCNIASDLSSDLMSGIRSALEKLKALQDHFRFELRFHNLRDGGVEASRNSSEIKESIHQEVEDAFRVVSFIMFLFSLVVFFVGLCVLFYKSYSYIRCYMVQDKFDNTYVTAELKQLDAKNLQKDKLFPLKKLELSRVIDITSPTLTKMERSAMLMSLVPFLISLLTTIGIFLVDHALYGLLDVVNRYGDVQVKVDGSTGTRFEIPDTGLLSRIMRTWVQGFELSSQYNVTIDLSLCVPQAHPPSITQKYGIGVLYCLTLVVIGWQAYGLRLRHKITAIFYPTRQKERLFSLYTNLKDLRKRYKKTVKRNTKISMKENRITASRSMMLRLAHAIPSLFGWLTHRWLRRKLCVSCREAIIGLPMKCVRNAPIESCEGVMYCATCSEDLGQMCPICDTRLDVPKQRNEGV